MTRGDDILKVSHFLEKRVSLEVESLCSVLAKKGRYREGKTCPASSPSCFHLSSLQNSSLTRRARRFVVQILQSFFGRSKRPCCFKCFRLLQNLHGIIPANFKRLRPLNVFGFCSQGKAGIEKVKNVPLVPQAASISVRCVNLSFARPH